MIWGVAGVDIQPEIGLAFWQVIELAADDTLSGRFLIGEDPLTLARRMSTPIQAINPDTLSASTRSARRYHLIGPPAEYDDAYRIWEGTLDLYGIPLEWQRNVTAEYHPAPGPDS